MSRAGYAQVGMEVMLRKAYAQAQRDLTVGALSSPRLFADQMKALDDAIGELKVLVETYVVRTVFKDNFNSFYDRWQKFYLDAQTFTSRTTIQIYDSDTFAAQIEGYRVKYQGFRDGYAREVDADGNPLKGPAPITPIPGPLPGPTPEPPDEKKGWSIAWYWWVLGGAATVGVGYWLYKKALVVRDARREIDKALPDTLGALIPGHGRSIGTFVAKHSPANDPSPFAGASHDAGIMLVPSGLAAAGDIDLDHDASGGPHTP